MANQRRKIVNGRQCCTMCSTWKPEDRFERSKICANGRGPRCKECCVKRTVEQISRTPEVYFKHFARRHHRNLEYRRNTRSRQRRDVFTANCITPAFLLELWNHQEGRCAVTGIPMTHRWGDNAPYANVSIDRIDSDIGYVRENVRLVCKAVNLMKHAMSQNELEFWCMAILEGHKPAMACVSSDIEP